MSQRECKATTKRGTPCKAHPLKDRDCCIAHADKKTRDATGFAITGGRPPKPRVVDVLRERMEAELDEWLAPLYEAREATKHVVVGNGPTAHVEEVPDIPTRLAAYREYMDRTHGKAKQTTEITGAEGGPVEVVPIAREKAQAVGGILAALGGTSGDG